MKKAVLFAGCMVAAMTFVTGCSGIHELQAALGEATSADEVSTLGLKITKNKTTREDVLKTVGAPTDILKNANGTETWTYNRVAVRQTNFGWQIAGDFMAIFPYTTSGRSYGGGLAGVGVASSIKTNKSSYKTAALLVNFNVNGCVDSYEFMATSF